MGDGSFLGLGGRGLHRFFGSVDLELETRFDGPQWTCHCCDERTYHLKSTKDAREERNMTGKKRRADDEKREEIKIKTQKGRKRMERKKR